MSKKTNKKINLDNKFYLNKVLLAISFFILGLLTISNYISNENIFEGFLYYIIQAIRILLGRGSIWFFISVFIVNLLIIKRRKNLSNTYKIKKILYVLSFFCFSIFLTVFDVTLNNTDNIVDAGQELLSYAIQLKKGGGLLGAILSIPFYKIFNNLWFLYLSLIVSLILFILASLKFIRIIYLTIKRTQEYYASEEYANKKKVLLAKEEYRKKLQMEELIKEEEEITKYFINNTNKKLDEEILKKIPFDIKDENDTKVYSEEIIDKKQKEWLDYYNRIQELNLYEEEKRKEKLEKARLEKEKLEKEKLKKEYEEKIEEEIYEEEYIEEKEEKIYEEDYEEDDIIDEYYDEIIEDIEKDMEEKELEKPIEKKVEEPISNDLIENTFDREKLKESIEEIFKYKTMDPSKKEEMKKEIQQNIYRLEETLKNYKVDAEVIDYGTGPTITRYEIKIPHNVRVKRVTELESELKMHLKAESIRIEAPIPGKDTIGIETPNKIKEPVYFSNMIHSDKLNEGILPVILGKNIVGKERIIDIAKLPHLLISGTTGSGKSVVINTMIASLISKKSPEEVKFIMVDPKMVELMPYNGIAHLLTPVIIDPNQASIALKWAVNEMEERYKKLASLGLRNIEGYNIRYPREKMYYLVIVIDELADLMMVASNNVEQSIARIAQKARAVGIHLIVATQRPSVDVVTGLIKANLPSRLSCALRSSTDSRTILDQVGAEKLLGKGDMLFLDNGKSALERLQGAYIDDEEVYRLTDLIRSKYVNVSYNDNVLKEEEEENSDKDLLFDKAVELAKREEGAISISLIQRELNVGFNRGSRICSQLKKYGILDENNRYTNFELK